MKPRTLIIGIGALVLVVLMIIGIFSAIGDKKLTLHAEETISKVSINGTSQDFKQDMKIDYKEAVTIGVAQDGYDEFKVTLDPTKDKISDYTIKLTKKTNAPVGSTNYDLYKAAETDDQNVGLIANSQLAVNVKDSKAFSDGYSVFTIDSDAGTALVVTQKTGDSVDIVLGPGTSFNTVDLGHVPDDVAAYLKNLGIGEVEE